MTPLSAVFPKTLSWGQPSFPGGSADSPHCASFPSAPSPTVVRMLPATPSLASSLSGPSGSAAPLLPPPLGAVSVWALPCLPHSSSLASPALTASHWLRHAGDSPVGVSRTTASPLLFPLCFKSKAQNSGYYKWKEVFQNLLTTLRSNIHQFTLCCFLSSPCWQFS